MLAGIGLHLGSVEGYMTQAHHPRELTQPQNLNEKTFQSIKAAAAKLADGAVVLLLVTGQHPEGQVLIAGTLNLPGGDDAHAVGIEQQHRQPLQGRLRLHPRVESLLPTRIFGLGGDQDLGEI